MRILKNPTVLSWIKPIYDQSLWSIAKTLVKKYRKRGASFADFMPPTLLIGTVVTFTMVFKAKYSQTLIPKYYPYINIYRPDDPKVAFIRKDNSLLVGSFLNGFSMHKQREC